MHTCAHDKVLLTFEATVRPREANTSRNLEAVRSAARPWQRALQTFSYITGSTSGGVEMRRDGVITVRFTCDLIRVYVAEELSQYAGAVSMVFRHERAHAAAWEAAMAPMLQTIGTVFEQRLGRTPNVDSIMDVAQPLRPRVDVCVRNSTKALDQEDYPPLRAALLRLGVPADLGTR